MSKGHCSKCNKLNLLSLFDVKDIDESYIDVCVSCIDQGNFKLVKVFDAKIQKYCFEYKEIPEIGESISDIKKQVSDRVGKIYDPRTDKYIQIKERKIC